MRVLAGCRIYIYAISFLTGAVVIQGVSELPPLWYFSPIPPLFALGFRFRWLWPLIFLSLGCTWAVFKANLLLAQALPHELERKALLVDGVISSLVQRNERYLKFTVDVESLRYHNHAYSPQKTIRLHWYYPEEDVHIGQGWRFRVRLKRPHGFQNPGGFDYERWLFRHGIRATGYVLDAEQRPEANRLSWSGVLRERVQHHLYHSGLAHQGLLRALAIGDRGGVIKKQWEVLQRTGTIHLMAISGLHIGLVSGFCFVIGLAIARLLGETMLWLSAPKLGAVLGMAGGGMYALLAGFTVPTQRAAVMVVAVMVAILVDRSIDLLRSLAIALIIVLLIDPLSVLDTGFWLSFAAVISIVVALRFTSHMRSKVKRMVFVQIILTVILAPLVLMFFGQVSISSPLANLVAIPVVAFAVVPLVLGGSLVLGMGGAEWASFVYDLADSVLGGLWRILAILAKPDWVVWFHSPTLGVVALAVVGLLWQFSSRPWYWRSPGLLCAVPLILKAPLVTGGELHPGEFTVTVLDVGQGLSVVVRTKGHVMLYDTGARFNQQFDAGAAVVVPYLRHQFLDHIHTLVVSHGDNDHIGGMQSVIAAIDTTHRLTSVRHRIPGSESCVAGQQWNWDGVMFTVLSPENRNPPAHNNSSCVLKIEGRYGSILLTGDIERVVETFLVRKYGDSLRADVLQVPHQGSKTSSSVSFIDAVAPKLAIVSAGYLNKYGHPADIVTGRYRQRNIELYNTAQEGAVTVQIAKGGTEIERYRVEHKRYWFGQ